MVQSTNISRIFSSNLKLLVGQVGNISEVARTLDIGRVQFNRYLTGQAYPKPTQLKKICDFFGVDARILTHPFPAAELENLPTPSLSNLPVPVNLSWEQVGRFLSGDSSGLPMTSELEDGLYLMWRQSMVRSDLFVCTPIQIRTRNGIKTCRMYGVRSSIKMTSGLPPKEREYRGLVFRQVVGSSVVFLPNTFNKLTVMINVSHDSAYDSKYLIGNIFLGREEKQGKRNSSVCVLEALPQSRRSIIRAANWHRYLEFDELPKNIATLF